MPLSCQAVEILRSLLLLTYRSRYAFEGIKGKPYSENTLNKLFEARGCKGRMTQHGWRAVARTFLDEILDFRVDWIEHHLARSVKDASGRAYNRTSHLEGRTKRMKSWADYLDALKEIKSAPVLNVGPTSTPPVSRRQKTFTSIFEQYHNEMGKQNTDKA